MNFEITGTGGITGLIEVTQQPIEEENRSILTCRLYLKAGRWYGVTYWLQGTVLGKSFSSNWDDVYLPAIGQYVAVSQPWEVVVDHDANGAAAFTAAVSLRGYTADGNYGSGWRLEDQRTLELTPIAMASTVSVTDGNIGDSVQITVTPKNSSYTHTLQYFFGGLSGDIDPQSLTLQLRSEFYYEIPNSPSGVGRVVCTTWDGDRQVGQPTQAEFTVYAADCAPLLQPRVADINPQTLALTGDAQTLVRFLSQVQLAAEVTAQKGATVVSVTGNGQPLGVYDMVSADRFSFLAVDSRGFETAAEVSCKLIPYVMLTANGSCTRVDPETGTARLTVRGSGFWGDFGMQRNNISCTATVAGRVCDLTVTEGADSYSATIQLEQLSYEQPYTITVTVSDALMSVTTTVELGRGVPVFDWGARDFAFHVPVTAPRINGIKNPALKAWPVGAVLFGCSDPTDSIGGKWAHFTVPGIDLDAWRRLQGGDLLGTAILGQMLLGTEE